MNYKLNYNIYISYLHLGEFNVGGFNISDLI